MSDRERYKPKTPPAGIAEQIARPARRELSARELAEMTPVHAISAVRLELRGEIGDVRGEVRETRTELYNLGTAFSEHREEVAGTLGNIEGKLDIIPRALDALTKDRDADREIDRIVTTTEVDIKKHRAITDIDEGAAEGKAKRELRNTIALRIFAIVSALIAGVLALLQADKC